MFHRFKINFKMLKKVDKTATISMILLVIFGILNIYIASRSDYQTLFLKRQSLWLIVSMVALYFMIAIDYSIFKAYTPLFYWLSVALLILTMFIGTDINGARGWIRLGPASFQPSELAKMATIMMLGRQLEDMDGTINELKNFM
ncbi:MAG: FtsW/RodA/SpoVE family cell cycle protein, partial [Clostridium sp.]